MKKFKGTFAFTMIFIGSIALAHNQSPATIRRSMEKAFKVFEASAPANVYKGDRSLRIGSSTVQIFEVKQAGKLKGTVAQLEFQEEILTVSVDSDTHKILSVVKAGSKLQESEWQNLSIVEEIRKALTGDK